MNIPLVFLQSCCALLFCPLVTLSIKHVAYQMQQLAIYRSLCKTFKCFLYLCLCVLRVSNMLYKRTNECLCEHKYLLILNGKVLLSKYDKGMPINNIITSIHWHCLTILNCPKGNIYNLTKYLTISTHIKH